jgi:subtilisin family serine protease
MTSANRRNAAGSIGVVALLIAGILAVAPPGPAAAQPPFDDPPPAISDGVLDDVDRSGQAEVIIELAPTAAALDRREEVAASLDSQPGVLTAEALDTRIPLAVATVDAAGLDALTASDEVARVTPNRRYYPTLSGSTASIGAPAAWTAGFDGGGQTVAVIDTGVDRTHPFLTGRVTGEACFTTHRPTEGVYQTCEGGTSAEEIGPGAGAPCPWPACEHGTHVAGIAAGSAGPTNAPSGVARGASVIAVQVFSRDAFNSSCGGPCVFASDADLLRAFNWLYERQLAQPGSIAAINVSLGGAPQSGTCDGQPLASYIGALRSLGTTTVIASGNNGRKDRVSNPSCISAALTVGALDDAVNQVPWWSNSSSLLDLLAPGAHICSSVVTVPISTVGAEPTRCAGSTGRFGYISGTSMAAPHVAGAIAVLRHARPNLTVGEIELILERSGTTVVDLANGIGKPRLRLDRALSDLAPFGSVDSASSAPGTIWAAGWVIDPDTPAPVDIEIRVDGVARALLPANQSRPDVGNAFPGYGANHGWYATVNGVGPGSHQVCAYGVNQPGSSVLGSTAAKQLIGCRSVTMPSGNPFGSLDSARGGPRSIIASGWAIDPDTTGPVVIHTYVDGKWGGLTTANASRPDVGTAYRGYGNDHGWQLTISGLAPGTRRVCAYAINQGAGTTNPLIACRNVVVPSGNPFGSLDSAVGGPGTITASGWVIDPDTAGAVQLHTYVDGKWGGLGWANTSRPDVGAAFPGYGNNHGYRISIGGLSPGTRRVCIYAINISIGTTNPQIACRNVAVL